MALLIEKMMEKENRWSLQVVQQTLSLLVHLPMRLLDWDKVVRLKSEREKAMGASNDLTDDAFFHRLDPQTSDWFNDRNNSGWVTATRNMHPLVEYLRRNPNWLGSEHIFFTNWLENTKIDGAALHNYFQKEMQVATWDLRPDTRFPGFLFLGPVFARPIANDEPREFRDQVEDFVKAVYKDVSRKDKDHKPNLQQMLLLGPAKGWMYSDCLEKQTKLLANALRSIFTADCSVLKEDRIKNSEYNAIARIAFQLHNELDPPNGKIQGIKDGSALVFKLPSAGGRVLTAEPKEGAWKLSFENHPDMKKPVWIRETPDAVCDSKLNDDETALEKRKGELGQSFATQWDGYADEKVNRLYQRLNNEFGVLSTEAGLTDHQIETRYYLLARRIADLFLADIVKIFLYDHSLEELIPEAAYFDANLSEEKKHEWWEAERRLMRNAASDTEMRAKIIAYEAAKTGRTQFWPEGLDRDQRGHAPDKSVQNQRAGLFEPQAQMAIPLIIYGRMFGVLEINGFSPYQFRHDNMHLAQRIGDIIGPFVYRQKILTGLQRVGEQVLDRETPDQKRLNVIAEECCKIFMAHASALFMPPVGKTDVFDLIACHNRKDMMEFLDAGGREYRLEPYHTDSPLIDTIYSGKNIAVLNIKEWIKRHPGWADNKELPLRKNTVNEHKYENWIVIPTRDPKTNKSLGGLSLYYKAQEGRDSVRVPERTWEPVARFISNYAALSIAAIETRRDEDAIVQNLLRHQIRHLTVNMANDIAATLKRVEDNRSERETNFLRKSQTSIDNSKKILLKTVDLLQSEDYRKFRSRFKRLDPHLFILSKDGELNPDQDAEIVNIKEMTRTIGERYAENRDRDIEYLTVGTPINPRFSLFKFAFENSLDYLFFNACDYSQKGKTITVRFEETDRHFRVKISNQAPSLKEPSEKWRLMEYRHRGSNKGGVMGTGLGLFMVRLWCEFAGISFRHHVEEVGLGTSRFDFLLTIPRLKEA